MKTKGLFSWLAALILAEVIFKVDLKAGFFAYLALLVAGIVVFLVSLDSSLPVLLAVPVVRIASFGIILGPGQKALLGAVFLGFVPAVTCLVQRIPVPGFSLELVDHLLTERKRFFGAFSLAAVIGGGILGFLAWRLVEDPPFTWLTVVLTLVSAVVYEFYFRALLLREEKSWLMILASSAWFGVLVFSGSALEAVLAFAGSILAGFVFVRTGSVYLPIAGQAVFQLVPVIL